MYEFKITKERKVFLGDVEIKKVLAFSLDCEAAESPEVTLRISVDQITIDGYSNLPKKESR